MLLLGRESNTAQMRLTMLLGLSLTRGLTEAVVRHSLTEAVVRHSGQYLQCSRGDCLMVGDSEVDLSFDQPKHLSTYQLRLYILNTEVGGLAV